MIPEGAEGDFFTVLPTLPETQQEELLSAIGEEGQKLKETLAVLPFAKWMWPMCRNNTNPAALTPTNCKQIISGKPVPRWQDLL